MNEKLLLTWANLFNFLYVLLDSYTTYRLFTLLPMARDISLIVTILHLLYGNTLLFMIMMVLVGIFLYLLYSLIIYMLLLRWREPRALYVAYCFLLLPIIYRAYCASSNMLHIVDYSLLIYGTSILAVK